MSKINHPKANSSSNDKIIKASLVVISVAIIFSTVMNLDTCFMSSEFDAFAQQGGNAVGGSATGGDAIGGDATGGSASGPSAIGGSANGGSAAGQGATGGNAIGGDATSQNDSGNFTNITPSYPTSNSPL